MHCANEGESRLIIFLLDVALYDVAQRLVATDVALNDVRVSLVNNYDVIVFVQHTKILYGAHYNGFFGRLAPVARPSRGRCILFHSTYRNMRLHYRFVKNRLLSTALLG